MSNPNNGATLEDCHSNFFALTDLCGIKWRRLVWECNGPHHAFGPLDDPVLSSFARCLAADLLCVWRRSPNKQVPTSTPNDPFHSTTPSSQSSPHYIHHHGPGGGPQQMQQQQQHISHMIPPHHMNPHLGGMTPHPSQSPIHPPPPLYNSSNNPSLNGPKELWIFWFGEEPDLNGLVSSQLLKQEAEQGSWDCGLSYECRTLLFKALHNLIERCLSARDFVRIGKWFIQPSCDDNQRIGGKSSPLQLSFSFSFFVHGESTVCMSVDVRQHPAIRRISKQNFAACQSPNHTMPVILAPHGLSGTLTGIGYKMNEPGTNKILEEWKHFYPVEAALKSPIYDTTSGTATSPLPSLNNNTNPQQQQQQQQNQQQQQIQTGIPPVLEVIVAGVRMRYPSCYVLSTEMDEPPPRNIEIPQPTNPSSQSTYLAKIRSQTLTMESENAALAGPSPGKPQGTQTPSQTVDKVEGLLPERVWQEGILCSTKPAIEQQQPVSNPVTPTTTPSTATNSDNLGQWDFTDPTKKSICTCSRCKRSGSRMSAGNHPSSQSTKGSSKVRKNTFHKRNVQQLSIGKGWSNMWDLTEESASDNSINNSQNLTNNNNVTSAIENQNPNNQPSNIRISGTSSGGPSFKGPGSSAAISSPISIIATPKSQPPSIPPMPTLSPQQQQLNDKAPSATPDIKSVSSLSNQVFSPMICDGAKSDPVSNGVEGNNNLNNNTNSNSNNNVVNENHLSQSTTSAVIHYETARRPLLPLKDYESLLSEEDSSQPSEIIYDYSTMSAWLNSPVKKMKMNNGAAKVTNFYWGYGMKSQENFLANSNFGIQKSNSGGKGQADPYEFDDENHQAPAVTMEGLKRKDIKDEEKSPYQHSGGGSKVIEKDLFTLAGITPSMGDLDQIFDNSDTSSDEAFQAPTPPGSNKPDDGSSTVVNSSSSKQRSGLGILRPEELSKMFPTPPSHEHNPIASPSGNPLEIQMDGPDSNILNTSINIKRENYPGTSSPDNEIFTEDWSFVFKPPINYKMLGSSKYTPLKLHLLPSLNPPPKNCIYKAEWQQPPASPSQQQQQQQQQQQSQAPTQISQPIHHPQPPQVQPQNFHLHPVCLPNIPNQMHLRPGLSPISPVPNRGQQSSFDLGSPPSYSSMYLKQGNHGVMQHGSHNNPHQQIYGSRLEAHALVVNLSLSDSVINLFRDHNFDSCTMCVCNAGLKVVGNIRGSEDIPPDSLDEDSIRCNCGFSASVNRRLAHRAGLFYEDEYEITTPGLAPMVLPQDEWYERKKPSFLLLDQKYPNMAALAADKDSQNTMTVLDMVPPYLLDMLKEQCLLLFGSYTASKFTGEIMMQKWTERTFNYLEYLDGNRAALTALEHGRTVMLEASGRSGIPRYPEDSMPLKSNNFFMHKWPYLWARGPKSSQDVMKVMRYLHPLLQDAVHAKAWDAQYTVTGPLTWRQFHRLAGRGTDDRCEPQPIPSILVGSEKDWVSLSPLAIKFWEKLLLEPYGYSRDIAYIVVAPDNDFVLQKVRTFFRELSTMYEVSQLGRHCPVTKVLRDGILRVGRNAATKLAGEQVDEWFTMLPDIPTSAVLKLYAQVCRYYLAPQLASISLDQSLLDNHTTSTTTTSMHTKISSLDKQAPSPKMPPPDSQQGPPTPKSENGSSKDSESSKESSNQQDSIEDDERDPPALVIYLVEPFGFGSDSKDLHRLANIGLMRCYTSMLSHLPDQIKNNITLQVISLEEIMNLGNNTLESHLKIDQLRALGLSIYSQCRRILTSNNIAKSLTGFGPAAGSEQFLKTKDEKKRELSKLYTPPFVLAPTKEKVSEGAEWLIGGHTVGGMVSNGTSMNSGSNFSPPTTSSVLYVSYCISEDQRWLLATATDERGELLETTCISIYVPNRSKRKKASPRKHGLQKLMDFILGVISNGYHPWRLVVGRLGRIGHGELESWSSLLSRKSLLRASNQLKDACRQCFLQYPMDTPCILSACLVSLEPDSCLRLMPDQFTPDERFGQSSTSTSSLSTPQDISCTHILVFPTSATTQSSQTAFQEQHINGPELGDDDLLFINVNDDMTDGIDGMTDLQLGDIFSWADTNQVTGSPVGSPRRDSTSQPGSPGIGGRQSPFQSGQGRTGNRDSSDELGTLLQQPLALGYLVSTAPSGYLPPWFWASCPQRANEKGNVFLKSALHLHSHSIFHNLDDLLQHQSSAKQHPLDSQLTTDVLRFVLEGYNALSWLCLDPKTHDRKSCLPVHIQKLLQLYYTISTLV